MKVKAAVLYESNKPLKVEKVDLAEPQVNEVLVKLVACGVCHTDLHFMKNEMMAHLPIVLGHEGAGIVEKVGPGVTMLKPGDHVVMMVSFSCGRCRYCYEGKPTLCVQNLPVMGGQALPISLTTRLRKGEQELHHLFGLACYAEYTVVHERSCVKVREDAPMDKICLLGCGVATGLGSAINTAGVRVGESVVVWGAGGVGLSAVIGAKLAGAGKIIAVARNPKKLELAKQLGADYVVNASEGNPVKKVQELTRGGADYAIESAGTLEVMQQAYASIHPGGKCIIAGMAPLGTAMPIQSYEFLLGKTITGTVQGDINAQVDIPRYVDMFMNGKMPFDKMISKTYALEEVNEAFEALEKGEVIRSVIKM
jgi:S-(hydroxymethyl)glutathione dehydrogenase / alcohol dehydrogenase